MRSLPLYGSFVNLTGNAGLSPIATASKLSPLSAYPPACYNRIRPAYRRTHKLASNSSLQDIIFSLPIIDTHAHIRKWADIPQPVTGYTLLNSSANLRMCWAAAGALSRQEFRQGKSFLDWPSLSCAIEQIKATAYYRIILDGLKNLFDIDFDELDEESFNALGMKLSIANQDSSWYSTMLKEKSGFTITCQDTRSKEDRSLFAEVARMDAYVLFGQKGWADSIIQKHGEDQTSTISALTDCLRKDFQEIVNNGAVAIKSNNCWTRTLEYEHVETGAAENALAECITNQTSANSAKILGDYMMDMIAKLCAEYDIPLQIHTGPAGGTDHIIQYGNPLNLNSIILRNPTTKFCIFHAGGPFVRECCSLATQYPNVYLDLCGVLGRDSLKRILDDWIEYVPQGKLMWGTDVHMVEESYAISQSFRQILSEFLISRVQQGYFSQSTAESFAKGILADNARRILRLPTT